MLHPQSQSVQPVQTTPIKRNKLSVVELGTAQSETNAPTPTLEELDAKTLFEQFEQVVRVCEDDPEIEASAPLVERKLDYEAMPTAKLSFSPGSESMKKKRGVGYGCLPEAQVPAITLFEVHLSPPNKINKSWKAPSQEESLLRTPSGQRSSMAGLEGAPMKERNDNE